MSAYYLPYTEDRYSFRGIEVQVQTSPDSGFNSCSNQHRQPKFRTVLSDNPHFEQTHEVKREWPEASIPSAVTSLTEQTEVMGMWFPWDTAVLVEEWSRSYPIVQGRRRWFGTGIERR